jgi:putative dehydrogenase
MLIGSRPAGELMSLSGPGGPRSNEDDDYAPLSAVEIFVKDLGLVLNTGHELRLPLPLAAAAHQLFLAAAGAGWGKLDDAAVVKVYEQAGDFKVSSPKR